jgi:hypothetical protein
MTADIEINLTGPMNITGTGKLATKGTLVKSNFDMAMGGMTIGAVTVADAQGILWNQASMGPNIEVTKMDTNAPNAAAAGGSNPLADSPASMNPADALREMPNQFENLTLKDPETIDGQEVYVFEGTIPKAPGGGGGGMSLDFNKATIKVAKSDGIMRQLAMSSDAMEMLMSFKNIAVNPAIDDAEFVYTPPPNVPVKDLTGAPAEGAAPAGAPTEPSAPRPEPAPPASQ